MSYFVTFPSDLFASNCKTYHDFEILLLTLRICRETMLSVVKFSLLLIDPPNPGNYGNKLCCLLGLA